MTTALRARYAAYDWRPVTDGMSGAGVWRLSGPGELFVKTAAEEEHAGPGAGLRHEAACAGWLRAQGLPAPEVVDAGAADGTAWLVTEARPGRSLAEPWPEHLRGAAVEALARFARRLHGLPVDGCPFVRDLAVTVPLAGAAVAAGLVDEGDFDAERRGRSAAGLLAELERTRPAAEDLVVCHGDLCAPNVLVDPGTLEVSGVIDLGRLGVADRHLDLALAFRSLADENLNPQHGPAAAELFLRAYRAAGADEVRVDPARMEFYTLLDEFF
ncbi:aminoglycoside 3'-phosphotransferase [Streptomyces sp. WMMC500]|uniref:APH(3') family aminoglycoside O-phosphotransferase n=1 Tax=Streptomyces sp. WMMC500 TaxID=3015154 RepID=UPI00248AFF7B|nr:APH(3') family aminoglycoside O-phosphotransferase [Streptomyces sp. WMMC500]WBB60660.1 aminoglycoside 3'-phosphotransferase [Streptomyces sp. WMMC500]